jgi:DNA-binding response OmpR family regulator
MTRILVIEDDESLRETLELFLELEGFEVKTAEDGMEALPYFEGAMKPPDIVLLDLNMPNLSGRDFMAKVCEKGPLEHTHFVVFSASKHESLLPGVSCWLRKPADLTEIIDTIQLLTHPHK